MWRVIILSQLVPLVFSQSNASEVPNLNPPPFNFTVERVLAYNPSSWTANGTNFTLENRLLLSQTYFLLPPKNCFAGQMSKKMEEGGASMHREETEYYLAQGFKLDNFSLNLTPSSVGGLQGSRALFHFTFDEPGYKKVCWCPHAACKKIYYLGVFEVSGIFKFQTQLQDLHNFFVKDEKDFFFENVTFFENVEEISMVKYDKSVFFEGNSKINSSESLTSNTAFDFSLFGFGSYIRDFFSHERNSRFAFFRNSCAESNFLTFIEQPEVHFVLKEEFEFQDINYSIKNLMFLSYRNIRISQVGNFSLCYCQDYYCDHTSSIRNFNLEIFKIFVDYRKFAFSPAKPLLLGGCQSLQIESTAGPSQGLSSWTCLQGSSFAPHLGSEDLYFLEKNIPLNIKLELEAQEAEESPFPHFQFCEFLKSKIPNSQEFSFSAGEIDLIFSDFYRTLSTNSSSSLFQKKSRNFFSMFFEFIFEDSDSTLRQGFLKIPFLKSFVLDFRTATSEAAYMSPLSLPLVDSFQSSYLGEMSEEVLTYLAAFIRTKRGEFRITEETKLFLSTLNQEFTYPYSYSENLEILNFPINHFENIEHRQSEFLLSYRKAKKDFYKHDESGIFYGIFDYRFPINLEIFTIPKVLNNLCATNLTKNLQFLPANATNKSFEITWRVNGKVFLKGTENKISIPENYFSESNIGEIQNVTAEISFLFYSENLLEKFYVSGGTLVNFHLLIFEKYELFRVLSPSRALSFCPTYVSLKNLNFLFPQSELHKNLVSRFPSSISWECTFCDKTSFQGEKVKFNALVNEDQNITVSFLGGQSVFQKFDFLISLFFSGRSFRNLFSGNLNSVEDNFENFENIPESFLKISRGNQFKTFDEGFEVASSLDSTDNSTNFEVFNYSVFAEVLPLPVSFVLPKLARVQRQQTFFVFWNSEKKNQNLENFNRILMNFKQNPNISYASETEKLFFSGEGGNNFLCDFPQNVEFFLINATCISRKYSENFCTFALPASWIEKLTNNFEDSQKNNFLFYWKITIPEDALIYDSSYYISMRKNYFFEFFEFRHNPSCVNISYFNSSSSLNISEYEKVQFLRVRKIKKLSFETRSEIIKSGFFPQIKESQLELFPSSQNSEKIENGDVIVARCSGFESINSLPLLYKFFISDFSGFEIHELRKFYPSRVFKFQVFSNKDLFISCKVRDALGETSWPITQPVLLNSRFQIFSKVILDFYVIPSEIFSGDFDSDLAFDYLASSFRFQFLKRYFLSNFMEFVELSEDEPLSESLIQTLANENAEFSFIFENLRVTVLSLSWGEEIKEVGRVGRRGSYTIQVLFPSSFQRSYSEILTDVASDFLEFQSAINLQFSKLEPPLVVSGRSWLSLFSIQEVGLPSQVPLFSFSFISSSLELEGGGASSGLSFLEVTSSMKFLLFFWETVIPYNITIGSKVEERTILQAWIAFLGESGDSEGEKTRDMEESLSALKAVNLILAVARGSNLMDLYFITQLSSHVRSLLKQINDAFSFEENEAMDIQELTRTLFKNIYSFFSFVEEDVSFEVSSFLFEKFLSLSGLAGELCSSAGTTCFFQEDSLTHERRYSGSNLRFLKLFVSEFLRESFGLDINFSSFFNFPANLELPREEDNFFLPFLGSKLVEGNRGQLEDITYNFEVSTSDLATLEILSRARKLKDKFSSHLKYFRKSKANPLIPVKERFSRTLQSSFCSETPKLVVSRAQILREKELRQRGLSVSLQGCQQALKIEQSLSTSTSTSSNSSHLDFENSSSNLDASSCLWSGVLDFFYAPLPCGFLEVEDFSQAAETGLVRVENRTWCVQPRCTHLNIIPQEQFQDPSYNFDFLKEKRRQFAGGRMAFSTDDMDIGDYEEAIFSNLSFGLQDSVSPFFWDDQGCETFYSKVEDVPLDQEKLAQFSVNSDRDYFYNLKVKRYEVSCCCSSISGKLYSLSFENVSLVLHSTRVFPQEPPLSSIPRFRGIELYNFSLWIFTGLTLFFLYVFKKNLDSNSKLLPKSFRVYQFFSWKVGDPYLPEKPKKNYPEILWDDFVMSTESLLERDKLLKKSLPLLSQFRAKNDFYEDSDPKSETSEEEEEQQPQKKKKKKKKNKSRRKDEPESPISLISETSRPKSVFIKGDASIVPEKSVLEKQRTRLNFQDLKKEDIKQVREARLHPDAPKKGHSKRIKEQDGDKESEQEEEKEAKHGMLPEDEDKQIHTEENTGEQKEDVKEKEVPKEDEAEESVNGSSVDIPVSPSTQKYLANLEKDKSRQSIVSEGRKSLTESLKQGEMTPMSAMARQRPWLIRGGTVDNLNKKTFASGIQLSEKEAKKLRALKRSFSQNSEFYRQRSESSLGGSDFSEEAQNIYLKRNKKKAAIIIEEEEEEEEERISLWQRFKNLKIFQKKERQRPRYHASPGIQIEDKKRVFQNRKQLFKDYQNFLYAGGLDHHDDPSYDSYFLKFLDILEIEPAIRELLKPEETEKQYLFKKLSFSLQKLLAGALPSLELSALAGLIAEKNPDSLFGAWARKKLQKGQVLKRLSIRKLDTDSAFSATTQVTPPPMAIIGLLECLKGPSLLSWAEFCLGGGLQIPSGKGEFCAMWLNSGGTILHVQECEGGAPFYLVPGRKHAILLINSITSLVSTRRDLVFEVEGGTYRLRRFYGTSLRGFIKVFEFCRTSSVKKLAAGEGSPPCPPVKTFFSRVQPNRSHLVKIKIQGIFLPFFLEGDEFFVKLARSDEEVDGEEVFNFPEEKYKQLEAQQKLKKFHLDISESGSYVSPTSSRPSFRSPQPISGSPKKKFLDKTQKSKTMNFSSPTKSETKDTNYRKSFSGAISAKKASLFLDPQDIVKVSQKQSDSRSISARSSREEKSDIIQKTAEDFQKSPKKVDSKYEQFRFSLLSMSGASARESAHSKGEADAIIDTNSRIYQQEFKKFWRAKNFGKVEDIFRSSDSALFCKRTFRVEIPPEYRNSALVLHFFLREQNTLRYYASSGPITKEEVTDGIGPEGVEMKKEIMDVEGDRRGALKFLLKTRPLGAPLTPSYSLGPPSALPPPAYSSDLCLALHDGGLVESAMWFALSSEVLVIRPNKFWLDEAVQKRLSLLAFSPLILKSQLLEALDPNYCCGIDATNFQKKTLAWRSGAGEEEEEGEGEEEDPLKNLLLKKKVDREKDLEDGLGGAEESLETFNTYGLFKKTQYATSGNCGRSKKLIMAEEHEELTCRGEDYFVLKKLEKLKKEKTKEDINEKKGEKSGEKDEDKADCEEDEKRSSIFASINSAEGGVLPNQVFSSEQTTAEKNTKVEEGQGASSLALKQMNSSESLAFKNMGKSQAEGEKPRSRFFSFFKSRSFFQSKSSFKPEDATPRSERRSSNLGSRFLRRLSSIFTIDSPKSESVAPVEEEKEEEEMTEEEQRVFERRAESLYIQISDLVRWEQQITKGGLFVRLCLKDGNSLLIFFRIADQMREIRNTFQEIKKNRGEPFEIYNMGKTTSSRPGTEISFEQFEDLDMPVPPLVQSEVQLQALRKILEEEDAHVKPGGDNIKSIANYENKNLRFLAKVNFKEAAKEVLREKKVERENQSVSETLQKIERIPFPLLHPKQVDKSPSAGINESGETDFRKSLSKSLDGKGEIPSNFAEKTEEAEEEKSEESKEGASEKQNRKLGFSFRKSLNKVDKKKASKSDNSDSENSDSNDEPFMKENNTKKNSLFKKVQKSKSKDEASPPKTDSQLKKLKAKLENDSLNRAESVLVRVHVLSVLGLAVNQKDAKCYVQISSGHHAYPSLPPSDVTSKIHGTSCPVWTLENGKMLLRIQLPEKRKKRKKNIPIKIEVCNDGGLNNEKRGDRLLATGTLTLPFKYAQLGCIIKAQPVRLYAHEKFKHPTYIQLLCESMPLPLMPQTQITRTLGLGSSSHVASSIYFGTLRIKLLRVEGFPDKEGKVSVRVKVPSLPPPALPTSFPPAECVNRDFVESSILPTTARVFYESESEIFVEVRWPVQPSESSGGVVTFEVWRENQLIGKGTAPFPSPRRLLVFPQSYAIPIQMHKKSYFEAFKEFLQLFNVMDKIVRLTGGSDEGVDGAGPRDRLRSIDFSQRDSVVSSILRKLSDLPFVPWFAFLKPRRIEKLCLLFTMCFDPDCTFENMEFLEEFKKKLVGRNETFYDPADQEGKGKKEDKNPFPPAKSTAMMKAKNRPTEENTNSGSEHILKGPQRKELFLLANSLDFMSYLPWTTAKKVFLSRSLGFSPLDRFSVFFTIFLVNSGILGFLLSVECTSIPLPALCSPLIFDLLIIGGLPLVASFPLYLALFWALRIQPNPSQRLCYLKGKHFATQAQFVSAVAYWVMLLCGVGGIVSSVWFLKERQENLLLYYLMLLGLSVGYHLILTEVLPSSIFSLLLIFFKKFPLTHRLIAWIAFQISDPYEDGSCWNVAP